MTKDSFENIAAEIRTRLLLLSEKNTRSIRAVRREFSKRLANAPSEFVFQLTLLLLKHEKTVPRFFAYELVQHDRQASVVAAGEWMGVLLVHGPVCRPACVPEPVS